MGRKQKINKKIKIGFILLLLIACIPAMMKIIKINQDKTSGGVSVVDRSLELVESGSYEEAIEIYSNSFKDKDPEINQFMNLIDSLTRKAQLEVVHKLIDEYVNKFNQEDRERIYLMEAKLYDFEKDYENMEIIFQTLIDLNKEDSGINLEKLRSSVRDGDDYEKQLHLYSLAKESYDKGDYEEVVGLVNDLMSFSSYRNIVLKHEYIYKLSTLLYKNEFLSIEEYLGYLDFYLNNNNYALYRKILSDVSEKINDDQLSKYLEKVDEAESYFANFTVAKTGDILTFNFSNYQSKKVSIYINDSLVHTAKNIVTQTSFDVKGKVVSNELFDLKVIYETDFGNIVHKEKNNILFFNGDLSNISTIKDYLKTEHLYSESSLTQQYTITGSIDNIANLINLKELSIFGQRKMNGDISSLAKMDKLEVCQLVISDIGGELESISMLSNLSEFKLVYSNVSGDVGALSNNVNIRVLILDNRGVDVSLNTLSIFEKLQTLTLNGDSVGGGIESLSELIMLEKLDLNNTRVVGDVSNLSNMLQLEEVNFESTGVTGDIISLSLLNKINYVNFNSTKVYGDLFELRNNENFYTLFLANTKVGGDILFLKNILNLSNIDLTNTDVVGDISALSEMEGLITLYLSNTSLEGDIISFKNLRSPFDLNLSYTNIFGDLSVFQDYKLYKLNLNDTKITGNIDSLVNTTMFMELRLANLDVGGQLKSLAKNKNMYALDLSNTHVGGNINDLGNFNGEFLNVENSNIE